MSSFAGTRSNINNAKLRRLENTAAVVTLASHKFLSVSLFVLPQACVAPCDIAMELDDQKTATSGDLGGT